VTVIGNGELAPLTVRADQAKEEQQRLLDGNLAAALVDEVEPLRRAVETTPKSPRPPGTSCFTCPIASRSSAVPGSLRSVVKPVRRDRLDAERAQHLRQHVRRGREAVVDDEAEARARIASTSRLASRSCAYVSRSAPDT
jgi:hypothetical protein